MGKEITAAIVIPSHRRANRVYAKNAVANAILCVSEGQEEEYRKYNPKVEIVTHSDSIVGAAAKRKWMYEKWGDLCMVDDDVVSFYRLYYGAGEEGARLSKEEAFEVVQMVANVAHELNVYYFGFASAPCDPRTYNPNNPLRLTGGISGSGTIGMLRGSKLYNDSQYLEPWLIDDVYLSYLNAYYHRILYRDTRFGVKVDGLNARGGVSEYWSGGIYKKNFLLLKKLFGDAVKKKRTGGRGKMRSRWEAKMNLPF